MSELKARQPSPTIIIGLLLATLACASLALWGPWLRGDDRALARSVATLNGQWIGRQAQPFVLTDLEGAQHTLADYRGKVVFLNFWASFCEPCREEMPSMERLVRQYQDRGLVMIAISFDPDAQDARAFMAQFLPGQRSAMTVLHDPQAQVGMAYGTELLPETYLIDRDGRAVARFVNAYDWARPEVQTLIEQLLLSDTGGASRPLL